MKRESSPLIDSAPGQRARAAQVRANSSLTLEEREIALNAIRAETERTIRESLGDRVLRAYRERNEQVVIRQDGGSSVP